MGVGPLTAHCLPLTSFESIDLPPVLLRRSPTLRNKGGVQALELEGHGLTRRPALGSLFIQLSGLARRPPPPRERSHQELVRVRPLADSYPCADLYRSRALVPISVDLNLAARDGLGRQGAGFIEARRPEPLVQTYPVIAVGHPSKVAGARF